MPRDAGRPTRIVRQSIPFLSLLTGYVLFGPWRRGAGAAWRAPLAAAALGVIAALNFATPLRLTFPAEFIARGRAFLAERDGVAPAAVDTETGRHLFVNTRFLWPMPPRQALSEGARVLLQAPHPQHFSPYLYEGCNRRQRAAFLRADLDMKLIEVE